MRHRSHLFALFVLVSLLAARVSSDPQDLEFFTNFEDLVPNTSVGEIIVVGTTAQLGGDAFGGTVGIGQLYFSGFRAWMVVQSGTAVIDFPDSASEVQFWARAHSLANGDTVITAFDEIGGVIGSPVIITPPEGFQLVTFTGAIDSIEVVNEASNQLNAVDDFGFAPEPGGTAMLVSGGALVAALRRHARAAA